MSAPSPAGTSSATVVGAATPMTSDAISDAGPTARASPLGSGRRTNAESVSPAPEVSHNHRVTYLRVLMYNLSFPQPPQEMEEKLRKLDALLNKSMTYSSILASRLEESQKLEEKKRRDQAAARAKAAALNDASSPSSSRPSTPLKKGRKRPAERDPSDDEDESNEPKPAGNPPENATSLAQPPYITVPLREYQLQGVRWSKWPVRYRAVR